MVFTMKKVLMGFLAVGLVSAVAAPANPKPAVDVSKLPPILQKAGVTYAGDIQKIFETSCVKCHGPERAKENLRLDSREGVLKGSEHGAVIVPGKSAESPLVHAIAYLGEDEDHFMPPPGNKAGIKKLTAEEVGLIRAWIEQGAK